MKQRLISISEEKDKLLMKLAKERGGKKGSISATIEEALELLEKRTRQELAWMRLKKLSDNAQKWGIGTFNRKDAYADARTRRLERIVADRDD